MVFNFLKDVPGIGPIVKLGQVMKEQTIDANDQIQARRKKDLNLPVKAIELLQTGHELPDQERLVLWTDFEKFPVTEDAQEFGQRIAERILGGNESSTLRNTDDELIDYMMDRDFLSMTERPSSNQEAELRRRSRIVGTLRATEVALRTRGISPDQSFTRTLSFFDRSNMPKIEGGNVSDRAAWLQAFVFGYAQAWTHPNDEGFIDESVLYPRVQQMVKAFSALESVGYKQQITIARRMGFGTREPSGFDKLSGIISSGDFVMKDVQIDSNTDNAFEVYSAIIDEYKQL